MALRRWPLVAVLVVALALAALPAFSQVRGGIEVARERVTYHFDNPSSINTVELVPHFFEQYYRLDNIWITASAAYTAGVAWETGFGLTPTQTATATDYDTFFNPGGVVWVAGTSGDARIHSWRFSQQAEVGRAGPVALTTGYRLRVDQADFLDGDRTVSRDGVVVEQSVVTTREYTSAQRHEVFFAGRFTRALSRRWSLAATGDVTPATVHRLSIELPDKYPGATLVYRTTTLGVLGQVELSRTGTGWPFALSLQAGTTANYSDTQWVSRSLISAGLTVGRTW